jgi:UDP-N-acetylmuramoyl-tripeptide--D-alanyl-D-alanine ligase
VNGLSKGWLTVAEVERECPGGWYGPPVSGKLILTGASTDSRTIEPSNLFIALRGDRFDGHDYVEEAVSRGAVMAIVERPLPLGAPLLVVPDTKKALQGVARAVVSRRFAEGKRLVTLSGTAGKTTTRELIRLALGGDEKNIHSNRMNFNNEIGVPKTLWEWPDSAPFAVLEVGIRKPGDMDYLGSVLMADVAVLTSIGAGHLETLGTVHGVWSEKARLFAYLKPGGIAVMPLDLLVRFKEAPIFREKGRRFFFTSLLVPDTGEDVADGSTTEVPASGETLSGTIRPKKDGSWSIVGENGPEPFELPLASPSALLAQDVLLALGVARSLGIPYSDSIPRIRTFRPLPGRMEMVRTPGGVLMLLDHYNANPLSMKGAFEWSDQIYRETGEKEPSGRDTGRLWAILGDMLELGDEAPSLHRCIGRSASRYPFWGLLYKGHFISEFREGYQEGGGDPDRIRALPLEGIPPDDPVREIRKGDVVLVKGSRGMHLENEVSRMERVG